jgi:hypothetical protein
MGTRPRFEPISWAPARIAAPRMTKTEKRRLARRVPRRSIGIPPKITVGIAARL